MLQMPLDTQATASYQVVVDDDVEVVVREEADDPQEACVHAVVGDLLVAHAVRRTRGARRGHLSKTGRFQAQANKVHVSCVNLEAWQLMQQALLSCRCLTAYIRCEV